MVSDRSLHRERGSALLNVLVLTVVVTLLVGTVLAVYLAQTRLIRSDAVGTQGQYLAEQAVREGIAAAAVPVRADTVLALSSCPDSWTCRVRIRSCGVLTCVTGLARRGTRAYRSGGWGGVYAGAELDNAVALADRTAGRLTLRSGAHVTGPVVGAVDVTVLRPLTSSFQGALNRSASALPSMYRTTGAETLRRWRSGPNPQSVVDWHQALLDARTGAASQADAVIVHDGDLSLRTAPASLQRGPRTIYVQGSLTLGGDARVAPGTVFIAAGAASVLENAHLPYTTLIAQEDVTVERWTGTPVQIVSGRAIRTRDAHLPEPSLLVVHADSGRLADRDLWQNDELGRIDVGRGTQLDGAAIYGRPPSSSGTVFGGITVRKDAMVRGAVISAGEADIAGTVYGTVAMQRLRFYESPSHVINHVRGGTIDRSQRPASPLLPPPGSPYRASGSTLAVQPYPVSGAPSAP